MTETGRGLRSAPHINALQRAWLREIGMDKVWLREEEGAAAPSAAPGAVSGAAGKAAAPPSVAASGPAAAAPPARSSAAVARQAGPVTAPDASAARPVVQGAQAVTAAADSSGPRSAAGAASAGQAVRSGLPARPQARQARDTAVASPPVDLKQFDLDGLCAQVVACTACGLCQGRRNAVFGAGAAQASWLVVGEAPGEQEDRQGLPFVGRSGQLLDSMLASVGMSRETNVFIANVIKCRPPGNRNPKPEEIAACSPYLMRQIALLKPERILVLGRFAAQTLLGTDAPIGSLRGRVHLLKTDDREIPVVVSYHPAYLLRSPGEKARSWQDLQLAVSG